MAFPTTNLSMKYVCYHFGYLRARLSTLCTHPDINIWSKYKPVQHAQPRPSDWWKGGNGHCGIGILGHANFEDMMDSILSGAAQNTITGTIHLEVAGTSYTFNNVTVNFSYPSSTEFRATTGNLGSYSLRDGESKEISYSVSAQSLKQNGVFLGAKGWLFASNVNYATTIVLMEKPSN